MINDVLDDRFVLREDDGTWWEVGWDRNLATYWAQHLTTDAYGVEQLLAWHGADPGEVPTLNLLTNAMGRALPRDVARDLQRGRLASPSFEPRVATLSDWMEERAARRVPHFDFGSRWIDPERPDVEHRVSWVPTTGELYAVDRRSGGGVRLLAELSTHDAVSEVLVGWAAIAASPNPQLSWIHQRLEQVAIDAPPALAATDEVEVANLHLPAAPVAAALTSLMAEPGIDSDPALVARGLGLSEELVGGLIAGTTTELGVEEIALVCEALHCSPYALWQPEVASNILHAYGPERWPRHIEPLDDLRLEGHDRFVGRRLDAQIDQMVSVRTAAPQGSLHATCYRATGVLSLDSNSVSTLHVADAATPPAPDLEYHFTFRQIAGTFVLHDQVEFGAGDLAAVADRLQQEVWLASTALVRFIEPSSGAEQWLGRAEPGAAWEVWDDPRRYYPGRPDDVLDAHLFGYEPLSPLALDTNTDTSLPNLDL